MASAFKTVKFDGKIETFLGEKLDPVLEYSGTVKQYATNDTGLEAIKAAGIMPNTKEIVQAVNARLKAKARAAVIADVLEKNGYEKPAADAKVSLFNSMVATLKKAGRSEADAAKGAEVALGYSLAQAEEMDKAKADAEETENDSE